jgi:dipeptidyl aminopeptidase/acylaminoacyl peptidase
MLAPGDAALYLANASDGSHLLLAGGAGRPLSSSSEIWRANEWLREVKVGDAQLIAYTTTDGTPLNAWLLLPPSYSSGTKAPLVTIVYPGLVYGSKTPSSFSPYQSDFEHPQLFAALGYAVLLPSMPPPKNPRDAHALAELPRGVLPAIDAAIEKGYVDPDRVAVLGQSNGGFAVLGLITQTNRFRSAISSAGFSDLVSFTALSMVRIGMAMKELLRPGRCFACYRWKKALAEWAVLPGPKPSDIATTARCLKRIRLPRR